MGFQVKTHNNDNSVDFSILYSVVEMPGKGDSRTFGEMRAHAHAVSGRAFACRLKAGPNLAVFCHA